MTLLPRKLNLLIETNIEGKKRQTAIRLLVFGMFLAMIMVAVPAFAGIDNVGEFFGYKNNIVDTYVMILSGESARRTLGICLGNTLTDGSTFADIITNTLTVTAALGIILVTVHIVMTIIDESRKGNMTQDALFHILLTFLLPVLLIQNINLVTNALQGTGILMKDAIVRETYGVSREEYDAAADGTLEEAAIRKELEETKVYEHVKKVLGYNEDGEMEDEVAGEKKSALSNIFGRAGNVLLVCIIAFIDIGIRISIFVACFGVIARLIIYQAMLPISISDIGKDGVRSNGMRTIKRYLGTYLEIAMFYIINIVGWKICDLILLKQEKLAWLIICFVGAGFGIRAMMGSCRYITERIMGTQG